jgi:hypothetical protein
LLKIIHSPSDRRRVPPAPATFPLPSKNVVHFNLLTNGHSGFVQMARSIFAFQVDSGALLNRLIHTFAEAAAGLTFPVRPG